ncbi:hypothetical protein O3G_MSEX003353 [Manduca sexta]|uniref:Uncharacterized protein n=1 Tax=Manduca sexta TaxID=7130 RepID=A0A921YT81_MANSE|nr:hypothetical protein O3G_MSEX003353 [Manduca sexta]
MAKMDTLIDPLRILRGKSREVYFKKGVSPSCVEMRHALLGGGSLMHSRRGTSILPFDIWRCNSIKGRAVRERYQLLFLYDCVMHIVRSVTTFSRKSETKA